MCPGRGVLSTHEAGFEPGDAHSTSAEPDESGRESEDTEPDTDDSGAASSAVPEPAETGRFGVAPSPTRPWRQALTSAVVSWAGGLLVYSVLHRIHRGALPRLDSWVSLSFRALALWAIAVVLLLRPVLDAFRGRVPTFLYRLGAPFVGCSCALVTHWVFDLAWIESTGGLLGSREQRLSAALFVTAGLIAGSWLARPPSDGGRSSR